MGFWSRPLETADRESLRRRQWQRLSAGLPLLFHNNPFYRRRWLDAGLRDAAEIDSWEAFFSLPYTTKQELTEDQRLNPPFGTNSTEPARFVRVHQTSGTSDVPLRWRDTEESWRWWARCWAYVFSAAGVGRDDRCFFAFSFGPFIGFWSALEGARLVEAMAISGGAQSSADRLRHMAELEATVLLCTPTYALHLANLASETGLRSRLRLRRSIHAGEPGASIPETREQIARGLGAEVFDHTGLTEAGATGFECEAHPGGPHLNEAEFVFEVTGEGELVVTNLGRWGSPVVRYRTGDRVVLEEAPCPCGRSFSRLRGGILGRVDDMITVRGVNVFPSTLEAILRRYPEVEEFQFQLSRREALDELRIVVDCRASPHGLTQAIATEVQHQLGLRVDVVLAPPGSLPRFELKARRLIRLPVST